MTSDTIADTTESTIEQPVSFKPIRVILADDHAVVRRGIREFLEEDPLIRVVGEAADGVEALGLIARERPDVAVIDVQMPRLNGLEATERVRQQFPETAVLILTAYEDEPYIFAALRAGARGFLLKTSSSSELVHGVRGLAEGETVLSPAIAKKLVERLGGGTVPPTPEPLTERELQVLRLAGRGLGNKQIALALGISDRTVQGHLASIYAKLDVSTRTEAVLFAVREKWIALE